MSSENESKFWTEDNGLGAKGANVETAGAAQSAANGAVGSKTLIEGTPDIGPSSMPQNEAPQEAARNESCDVEDEKIYSQAQFDAWAAEVQAELGKQVEIYKVQAEKANADLAAEKERHTKACAWHSRKDAIEKKADRLIGDGSYPKICELKSAYVMAQMEADAKAEIEKKLKEVEESSQNMSFSYNRLLKENGELGSGKRALEKDNILLKTQVGDLDAELQKVQKELANWKSIGTRMKGAFVPKCLVGKEWFDGLLEDIEAEIGKDPPDDSAILLLASISEFAVMERNPDKPCFEWKKQLSDIGLVVAHYMHEKKVAEGDVVKMLRNFALALRESQTIAQLKIEVWVPELGPDFNVDRVKHTKNGSAVAKILNWCILDSNGVYSKAKVE